MKKLKDYTFKELVDFNWGEIVLAIGASGRPNEFTPSQRFYSAMCMAVDWRGEQDRKKAQKKP